MVAGSRYPTQSPTSLRFAVLATLLTALLSVAVPAQAQFEIPGLSGDLGGLGGAATDPVTVSAYFTPPDVEGNARLVVDLSLIDGWHIYSITQKKTGPIPTKIKVDESSNFKLTGDFQPTVPPEKGTDPSFGAIELHHHKVEWLAPIKINPGVDPAKLEIDGSVYAQTCGNGQCLPPKDYSFAANVDTSKETSAGSITQTEHTTIRGYLEPAVAKPGDTVKLVLTTVPSKDYHVYGLVNNLNAWKSLTKPTLISISTQYPGWQISPAETDQPVLTKDDYTYYEGEVTWVTEIKIPSNAEQKTYALSGLMGYQACSGKSCDPPQGVQFDADLMVAATTDAGELPLKFSTVKYGLAEKAAEQNAEALGPQTVDWAALMPMLGFALLGGFILNFMPCVLPVIGLKILAFVEQSGQDRKKTFLLNVWYTLGLISIFMVLASLAVMFNLGWGEQFGDSTFSIALAALVFAMALSFLGVWEIPIPGFVGSSTANEYAAKEGAQGAFFKGVLTTVLATPCSGPFLGPVFGFTVKQPPVVTYAIFLCIGLGMAFPYLAIGAYPKLLRFLPRPGAWMETFKNVMGFVLLGTVAFLFSFINKDLLPQVFALLVGIWAACWWIGRIPVTADRPHKVRGWAEGLSFAALVGVLLFGGLFSGSPLPWQEFNRNRIDQLVADGNTVMVDFTADWCLNCKTNERVALNRSAVLRYVQNNGVIPVKADWTNRGDDIKQMLNEYHQNAIPLLIVFPAGQPEKAIVLDGLISQGQVLDALKQAGPSKPKSETSQVAARP